MALLSINEDLNGNSFDMSKITYLENNTTTREEKYVIESIINHLKCSNSFDNPNSSHLSIFN
jgi:hypothetical protein